MYLTSTAARPVAAAGAGTLLSLPRRAPRQPCGSTPHITCAAGCCGPRHSSMYTSVSSLPSTVCPTCSLDPSLLRVCLTTGLSQGAAAAGQEGHEGPLLHHPPSCKAQGATHAAVPQALHSNRCRTCCTCCCSCGGGGGCDCCGWQLPAAHNQPCEPHRRVCGSITHDRSVGPRPSSSSSSGGCCSMLSSGLCTLCADKAAQHVSGPARQRQWQQQLHGAVQQPAEQLPQQQQWDAGYACKHQHRQHEHAHGTGLPCSGSNRGFWPTAGVSATFLASQPGLLPQWQSHARGRCRCNALHTRLCCQLLHPSGFPCHECHEHEHGQRVHGF